MKQRGALRFADQLAERKIPFYLRYVYIPGWVDTGQGRGGEGGMRCDAMQCVGAVWVGRVEGGSGMVCVWIGCGQVQANAGEGGGAPIYHARPVACRTCPSTLVLLLLTSTPPPTHLLNTCTHSYTDGVKDIDKLIEWCKQQPTFQVGGGLGAGMRAGVEGNRSVVGGGGGGGEGL